MPLDLCGCADNRIHSKNTAPLEADEIVKYAAMNKDKKIAVITPFANQRELINEKLKENGLSDITQDSSRQGEMKRMWFLFHWH